MPVAPRSCSGRYGGMGQQGRAPPCGSSDGGRGGQRSPRTLAENRTVWWHIRVLIRLNTSTMFRQCLIWHSGIRKTRRRDPKNAAGRGARWDNLQKHTGRAASQQAPEVALVGAMQGVHNRHGLHKKGYVTMAANSFRTASPWAAAASTSSTPAHPHRSRNSRFKRSRSFWHRVNSK